MVPASDSMTRETLSTIPELFTAAVTRRSEEKALGTIRVGELHWRTWQQVWNESHALAAELRAAGIAPGDRVAQVSENRYEWIITDLALHLAGAVHVPIHVTLSGEQIAEQIADCGAKLVFVSSRQLLTKFAERLDAKTQVKVHDEQGNRIEQSLLGKPAVARNVARKLAGSAGASPSLTPDPRPPAADSLATILYTSGTTGRSRGVMLSQRNLASNAVATAAAHGGDADQTRLCILPLSHIYARTCDLYTWVCHGSRLVLGECRETLARDLQLVRPKALNAVPYVYGRIAARVRSAGVPDEAAAVRAFFGGRMERLICGGAAIAPDVEAWYATCGLPIHCGYGLTEASPVVATCVPDGLKPGSVGRPVAGVAVRIADDGEVLVRGPNVMLGYWKAGEPPHAEEVIQGGWLHTGDLGELDADGFLAIRGRKKEMIVLSTGKNVAPTHVENLITASPLIEQAAVFGEGQSALVALIVPAEGDEERGARNELFAAEIDRCLAGAAREEQVRTFVVLDRQFSIERGELTPKLSLCRDVIAANFATDLKQLQSQSLQIERPPRQVERDEGASPRAAKS